MPQITVFIAQAVSNQWTSIQTTEPDVGIVKKYSTQHHSITTMSQKHGYTNGYCLKAMEILAQKFQILFQEEYARKWEEINVFSTC